jgi:hypothetical protein
MTAYGGFQTMKNHWRIMMPLSGKVLYHWVDIWTSRRVATRPELQSEGRECIINACHKPAQIFLHNWTHCFHPQREYTCQGPECQVRITSCCNTQPKWVIPEQGALIHITARWSLYNRAVVNWTAVVLNVAWMKFPTLPSLLSQCLSHPWTTLPGMVSFFRLACSAQFSFSRALLIGTWVSSVSRLFLRRHGANWYSTIASVYGWIDPDHLLLPPLQIWWLEAKGKFFSFVFNFWLYADASSGRLHYRHCVLPRKLCLCLSRERSTPPFQLESNLMHK